MKTSCILIINKKGNVVAKGYRARSFDVGFDEVSISVTIDLPDALFKKPNLQCSVSVPATAVSSPTIEMGVTDNIAAAIKQATGFEARVTLIPQEKK